LSRDERLRSSCPVPILKASLHDREAHAPAINFATLYVSGNNVST
jgi:hypothetical protein